MSALLLDSSKPSNFSTTIKLEGIQIDFWTNGPHECTEDVVHHAHTSFEVQAALSGRYSLVFADGRLTVFAPDTVCLIPPACPHRSCQSEPGSCLISLQFIFRKKAGQGDPTVLTSVLEQLSKEPALLTDVPELYTTMRLFSQELVMPEFASHLLLDTLLRQFYIQLLRCVKKQQDAPAFPTQEKPEPNTRNDRYSLIETFFQENYMKPITEKDLAQVLAVSKRQTSRILRAQYGKSFHEKLEEIRLYHAQQHLRLEGMTVENVAFQVGYSSASGFFVAFKKRFGMTPTEYRRTTGQKEL